MLMIPFYDLQQIDAVLESEGADVVEPSSVESSLDAGSIGEDTVAIS